MYFEDIPPLVVEGSWTSLAEVRLPAYIPINRIKVIRLTDLNGDSYTRLTIYYDDLGPFNPDHLRIQPIETRGSFKEAIEKGSYYGRMVEISYCGQHIYGAVYI